MKVLRVLTRLNIGGPARHALVLQRGLTERGWECVLAAGSSEGAEGDITDWDGVDVVRVPRLRRSSSPVDAARAIRFLRELIARERPDIVHTHMAMAGFCARVAARTVSPKPRTVHTFHGHVLEGYFSPVRERMFAAFERLLAKRTAALFAVSPQIRDQLLALRIGERAQWKVVPIGLQLADLLALEPPATGRRTVGVVGRLVPIKDHETLFRAFARLPQDVRLVVAGDGELRSSLEGFVRDADLASRVTFAGWVRDLTALYSSLDVVALSSRNEGTPVALIEAMASARPVVATNVGGVPDVVEHGRTGLLVPPGDFVGMADAIAMLLEDRALASRMGETARASVAERFGASRLVDDVDRLYRDLLEGGPLT